MSLTNAFNNASDPKPAGDKDRFFWCLRRGHAEDVKAFLEACPQAAKWHLKKEGTLHVAARTGNRDIIRMLIDAGAALEDTDEHGKTPLMHAALHNKGEAVDILLAHWAKIDAQDSFKMTALMHAVSVRNDGAFDAAAILLERGARHDIVNNAQNTALHLAAEENNVKAIGLLVAEGADIEARNFEGFTPFIAACRDSCIDAAVALAKAGADTDAEDDEGATGLQLAEETGDDGALAARLKDAIETIAEEKRAGIRNANAAGTKRQIKKRAPIKFGDK